MLRPEFLKGPFPHICLKNWKKPKGAERKSPHQLHCKKKGMDKSTLFEGDPWSQQLPPGLFCWAGSQVRQGSKCHLLLSCAALQGQLFEWKLREGELLQGLSWWVLVLFSMEQCPWTQWHFLTSFSGLSVKQRSNIPPKDSLQCPFLPLFLFLFGSSSRYLALKRLPQTITEGRSWRTQCWSRETFEINLKGTALFSWVAFGCPAILYVDYNRKIKFLIFSPLYLEKCKISYTWSLWALLSQIWLPILCHCHLLDDDLLVFIRAFRTVALVNTKVPVSKSHHAAHPNST